MIVALGQLLDRIEEGLVDSEIDLGEHSREFGTTEYHLRRMFSSLFGMSVSEYVRRRRMTTAAAEVIDGGKFLEIAVRYGYTSTEAFGRAFRSVHGSSLSEVRENGGPLRAQAKLRMHITIEGNTAMDVRISTMPALRLIGYAARVPLVHTGINPHIHKHVESIPLTEHLRLKSLSSAQPEGLLAVSAEVDPDYTEGSELTYLHGVSIAAEASVPHGLDVLEVPPGEWAIFRSSGPHPDALQSTWAATATDWFPANPWSLRPGPSIVAVLERAEDFSTATTELWLPVERN